MNRLSDDQVAAVRNATDAFAEAIASNNWSAYESVFAEDALVMPPNEPAIQGRKAIQEWGSALTVTDFTESSIVVAGRSGVAYVRGEYSITFLHGQMDKPVTEDGKFLEVWEEQADARWLLVVDIWNTDSPPPDG